MLKQAAVLIPVAVGNIPDCMGTIIYTEQLMKAEQMYGVGINIAPIAESAVQI